MCTLPCWEQSQRATSTPRLEGSMTTSRVRGHGERLLLSANEVGTWCSVSLRLCLSPHLPAQLKPRGALAMNACQVTPMPSSLIAAPATKPRSVRAGWSVRLPVGGEGVSHIRSCPVGKITNGSEIAVPQSGSSLSNECSHANPQSPHKPNGRRSL